MCSDVHESDVYTGLLNPSHVLLSAWESVLVPLGCSPNDMQWNLGQSLSHSIPTGQRTNLLSDLIMWL